MRGRSTGDHGRRQLQLAELSGVTARCADRGRAHGGNTSFSFDRGAHEDARSLREANTKSVGTLFVGL